MPPNLPKAPDVVKPTGTSGIGSAGLGMPSGRARPRRRGRRRAVALEGIGELSDEDRVRDDLVPAVAVDVGDRGRVRALGDELLRAAVIEGDAVHLGGPEVGAVVVVGMQVADAGEHLDAVRRQGVRHLAPHHDLELGIGVELGERRVRADAVVLHADRRAGLGRVVEGRTRDRHRVGDAHLHRPVAGRDLAAVGLVEMEVPVVAGLDDLEVAVAVPVGEDRRREDALGAAAARTRAGCAAIRAGRRPRPAAPASPARRAPSASQT